MIALYIVLGVAAGVVFMGNVYAFTCIVAHRKRKENAPGRPVPPQPVLDPPSVPPADANREQRFLLTRKEIADEIRRTEPAVGVVEHPDNPILPISLKIRSRTFAMLYAADDGGVSMIVRITDSYADGLARSHPGIRRATWPKGPNWYFISIDDTFSDADDVFNILTLARNLVAGKR
ncbi:hypothetical protein FACS1894211_06250 [Clostridia bacterium]|nr:hypothetical protein FACS1894211_06250 [Clostridia bacterium]